MVSRQSLLDELQDKYCERLEKLSLEFESTLIAENDDEHSLDMEKRKLRKEFFYKQQAVLMQNE